MIACYNESTFAMGKVSKTLKKIIRRIDKTTLLFIIALALIILANQVHFFFPDEFENIMGGRFIARGLLPYRDFFTHHNPFGYFFAYPLLLIGGVSFVRFRLLLGVVYFLSALGLIAYVRNKFGERARQMTMVLILFFAFGATYFWGNMLLADSLSGYLLIPAYLVTFLNIYRNKEFSLKDLWVISLFGGLALLTSSVVLYSLAILYLFAAFYFVKAHGLKSFWKPIAVFVLPYLVFLVYLVLSGSLQEFYYQAIRYNTDIYAKLPGGVSTSNPLRVAVVVFRYFIENFRIVMNQINDLNIDWPLPHALAVANIALWVYLFLRKKYALLLFAFSFLVYLTIRGNPATTAETDFHLFAYQHISMFNGVFVLFAIWGSLNTEKLFNKKVVYAFLIILHGVYFGALLFHLSGRWFDKAYTKYMGQLPLIYDKPAIAPVLNDLIPKDEFYFIAPFDFENQLYMDSKPASKYVVVLPGFDESQRMQTELLNDLKSHKPKIVVFNTEMTIYSQNTGNFVKDYLRENYVTLEDLKIKDQGYSLKYKWLGDYDFERHFFFDKSRQEELLQLLKDKGYLLQ